MYVCAAADRHSDSAIMIVEIVDFIFMSSILPEEMRFWLGFLEQVGKSVGVFV